MALAPGTRLGPYEVSAQIGSGGMGEVYRARDASLGRDVAIKVLPDAFAQDAERLARFEREARTLAALNHPNIAHVYGLEQADGVRGLVMELVEGPTLADRIAHGAIPLDEALPIAKQIAEALEAAHEQGIIHRDLKPANVKVRSDGTVKVLDFGLAKALGPAEAGHYTTSASSPIAMTNSPTLMSPVGVTGVGMILGTAAYMAPEQAKGRPVSKATDIWAFGCVLYEMLTGRALFGGDDVTEVLAAVVRADRDWNALPAATPREIRSLLRHCLEKDHRKRWQDASALRITLDDASTSSIDTAVVETPSHTRATRAAWVVAATFAVVAAAAGWVAWRSARPADRPLVRLDVDLGADVSLLTVPNNDVVISPDGMRIAWVSIADGDGARIDVLGGLRSRVYVRRLDQSTAIELPGTDGATGLFFSPDGQWLGFSLGGRFHKISVEGGALVPLISEQQSGIQFRDGVWGEDGTILSFSRNELWRIPGSGGEPVKVADLAPANAYVLAQVLPDGRNALAVSVRGVPGQIVDDSAAAVEVLSLADGTLKTLVRGATAPRYVPTGHLLYVIKGTLFAAPFDLNALEIRGTPVPILDDVQARSSRSALSLSREGTLVYRNGESQRAAFADEVRRRIEWIDSTGKRAPVTSRSSNFSRPRLSPDGTRLALLVTEPNDRNEWILDLRRDSLTKVTFGKMSVSTTAWSADGRYVFIGGGGTGIHWARADASGEPQLLLADVGGSLTFVWSYSREINRLAYAIFGGASNPNSSTIVTVALTEHDGGWKAGTPEPFFESAFTNTTPEFSPDGRWIAYTTNESGRSEVNVRPFPPGTGRGPKVQISTDGGENPRWSRTGSELLYESSNRIMSVRYTVNGDAFVADRPRVRVDKLSSPNWGWDLAPDGRILALVSTDAPAPAPARHTVVLLQNFFDELRRRAPIK